MLDFGQPPYAILCAANGQNLNAIERGMLTIQTITIVAYIFRDGDLVHTLLGIAPQPNSSDYTKGQATQLRGRSVGLANFRKPFYLPAELN
jgi:hypothetical protein